MKQGKEAKRPWNGKGLIRLFGSLRLTLVLLITLGLLSAVGTLVPQGGDYASFQRFLAGTVSRFFVASGLTELFTSSWLYRGLLLLFVVNLVFCSLLRFPRVWREFRAPIFPKSVGFFGKGRCRSLSPLPSSPEKLDSVLARISFRLHEERELEGGCIRLYRRQAWASFGAYVCHLGIVVLIAGGLVGAHWGAEGMARGREGEILTVQRPEYYRLEKDYRSAAFRLGFYRDLARLEILRPVDMAEGEALMKRMGKIEARMVELEKDPAFRARVLSARELFDTTSSKRATPVESMPSIANWVTELEFLSADGKPLDRRSLRVNQPLEHHGWLLYQADFGTENRSAPSQGRSLVVSVPGRATLPDGDVLEVTAYYPDFVVTMGADGKRSYGSRSDEPRNPAALVRRIHPGVEKAKPQLLFRDHAGHGDGQGQEIRFLNPEGKAGLRFLVPNGAGKGMRGRSYTGLSLSYDPGTPLVWAGAAFMVLGMIWAFYFRADSLWVLLSSKGEARIRICSHKGEMGEEWAMAGVESLQNELQVEGEAKHGTR